MQKFIFVDESGDLGVGGSSFLILAALIIDDEKPLKRIIKNMRRNKFEKELRKAHEIKANSSSPELITHMLLKLNEIKDAKVLYVVLEKKKLFSDYLKQDKHKLYNYVAGKLAQNLVLDGCSSIIMRIDKSKGKQLLQHDFNQYFLRNLKKPDVKFEINHSYSHSWHGLQFADILAWSCFQKFEHSNSAFVDMLEIKQEVYHVWKVV